MPVIKIKRSSEYTNRLRDIKVLIDGTVAGHIANGENKEFNVSPGNHTLSFKVDWCGSNEIHFNIHEGQGKQFEVESFAAGNFLKMLLAIYYITLASKKYLTAREVHTYE